MRLRSIAWLAVGTSLVLIATGCCAFRKRDNPQSGWSSQPIYPGNPGGPATGGANPEVLMPSNPPSASPAPPLPPPSSSGYAPPSKIYVAPPHNHPGVPPSLLPPSNMAPDSRFFRAPPPAAADMVAPAIQQTEEPPLAPVRPPSTPPASPKGSDGARILPPDLLDVPVPAKSESAAPAKPDPAASPSLPVGIPAYAEVKAGLASGLKPDLEGLDWLKANGFRSVLHVRKPGTPNSADHEQIKKRGLTYLTLEVAPETLNETLLGEFNKLVADPSLRSLFVYDKDGALAGALWYLHFRSVDKLAPEAARVRAEILGLKSSTSGEFGALWIAIQKIKLP